MLHTTITRSVCNGRQMGACQNHVTFFSFEKETFFQTILFALTVIFLLENILSTFPCEGELHHPRAWDRRGTKEGSNSTAGTRHQDVLLLEPKPFGFSTTIFSIWFLAGIRKKKKFVFIRSPSGKAPHPIPALPAGQASRNMALSLWIFISLGYWGRHLMRLLTETEKFWGKATTTKQSGMFSSHGRGQYFSFIEVFWQGCLLSKKGDFQVCSSALGEAAPSHSCLSYSWDFSVTKVTKSPVRHSRALNLVPHRVQVVTTCASIPAEILLILLGEMEIHDSPCLVLHVSIFGFIPQSKFPPGE